MFSFGFFFIQNTTQELRVANLMAKTNSSIAFADDLALFLRSSFSSAQGYTCGRTKMTALIGVLADDCWYVILDFDLI